MPRQVQAQRPIYECVSPFAIWVNGVPVTYVPGPQSRVQEGDPILRTHGYAFAPVTVEQATAAPGERRPVHIPDPGFETINTDPETKEADNG